MSGLVQVPDEFGVGVSDDGTMMFIWERIGTLVMSYGVGNGRSTWDTE